MENNIKILRKNLNLSQEDLAKHCNVTRQTINAIENNKYSPSLSLAFCIVHKLNKSIEEVFSN